jgi:hypothetical protein
MSVTNYLLSQDEKEKVGTWNVVILPVVVMCVCVCVTLTKTCGPAV